MSAGEPRRRSATASCVCPRRRGDADALVEALTARRDSQDVQLYHLHTAGPCRSPREGRAVPLGLAVHRAPLREAIDEAGRLRAGVPLRHPGAVHGGASRSTWRSSSSRRPTPRPLHARHVGRRGQARPRHREVVLAEINEQMPRTHGNTACRFARFTRSSARTGRCTRPKRGRRRRVESAHRRAGRRARRGRRDAADRHRRHPRRGARAARQQARPRRPHRDVLRRPDPADRRRRRSPTARRACIPGRTRDALRATARSALFDFVDDNPLVEFHRCDRTNDTALDPQEPERDGDQLGARDRSHRPGVRRLDRPRASTPASAGRWTSSAARRCRAEASRSSRCRRRPAAARCRASSPMLKPGAGVVTTRGHVHWVVTEYGARQPARARRCASAREALISIAHPSFRGELRDQVSRLRHFDLAHPPRTA